MKWYAGLETIVEENVPLADLTWYHLGGPARYFCRPSAVEHIREIVKRARDLGLPLKVLGEGANVLVRDEGFDGIVIQLSKSSFGQTSTSGANVTAGGATDLPDLVRRTVKAGLAVHESHVEKIHRRAADETGHKLIRWLVVDFHR